MGSGTDYSSQINKGLAQANLPKSNLSQQYSGLMGGIAPGILSSLLNTQKLGNSFLNVNGANNNPQPPSTYQPFSIPFRPNPNPIGNKTPYLPQINPDAARIFKDTLGADPSFMHADAINRAWETKSWDDFKTWAQQTYGGGSVPQSMNVNGGMSNAMLPPGGMEPNLPQLNPDALGVFRRTLGYDPTFDQYANLNNAWNTKSWDDFSNYLTQNFRSNPRVPFGDEPIIPNLPDDPNDPNIPNPDDPGDLDVPDPSSGMSPYEQQFFNIASILGIGTGQQQGINLDGFQSSNPNLGNLNLGGLNQDAYNSLLNNNLSSIPGTEFLNPSNQLLNQNGLSNFNPQISQLLNSIGGIPQGVKSFQLGQSGFNQQIADPGLIQNPGFQAQAANLSGIPTGTQLTGDSLNSYNAIAKIIQDQTNANVADTRERFTGLGGSRGTGASYAEAQAKAAALPQLQQALSGARNAEVSNQLQSAGLQSQNALANTGMLNQYGLGGAQLDVSRQGQNISNILSAAGINNQFGLGNAQLNADIGIANQGNSLQAQMANQSAGLQNQGMNNNLLTSLLGQQGQNLGILGGIANNVGQLNLGQNSLNTQNVLSALGLNQQGALGALQAQTAQQGMNNQSQLGMNQILADIAKANSAGANQFNLGVAGMNQAAAQQQIQNQLQSLMTLFGGGLGLAGQGIPGGSANINLGAQANQGGFAQTLGNIAQIIGAFV